MKIKNSRVVMIISDVDSSNIMYNYLKDRYNVVSVIVEHKTTSERQIERRQFLKRRIKKHGLLTVLGQVLFSLLCDKPMRLLSQKRINEILLSNKLSTERISDRVICKVSSINSQATIEQLVASKPDVVVVNCKRLISEPVLNSVNCPFMNTHAGITPKYRGVLGMYWALVNNDLSNCGVTVHFVDKGIDTGGVIYQAQTTATKKDNNATYIYLQMAEGVKLMDKAIKNYLSNNIIPDIPPKESHLYSHPTIWQYLWYRLTMGVK